MRVMEIKHGWGLDRLVRGERPMPTPRPGEVVVQMEAASINYRDLLMVRGGYGRSGGTPPFIPVSDGAGWIAAVGEGVTRVKVGELVCPCFVQNWLDGPPHDDIIAGMLGGQVDGVLQEFMLLPADGVVRVASHLDAMAAATLPCAALTAWSALTEAAIKPGKVVLTQGTGGVSLFALQLAKLFGAYVIVTSSSDEKLKKARQLGADATINYVSVPHWEKRAREIAGPSGVDIVVDLAGTVDQSVKAVRLGGTVCLVGVLAGPAPTLTLGRVVTRAIQLRGITAGSRRAFEAMMRAIEQHRLTPVYEVAGRSLEDAPQAIAAIENGLHFGKICLQLGPSR